MSSADQPHLEEDDAPTEFSASGMLLKLVLLPGSVVLVVVLAGLIFSWATGAGGDVESLIEQVAQAGNARWPAAVNLAAALHEPGGAAARHDPAVARRLSGILQVEIEAGSMAPEQIRLRAYLCRALGEFQVAEPLPVLLRAVRTERNLAELEVRYSAIEAIAVLVSNVGPTNLRDHNGLLPVLLAAAEDGRTSIRQRAAFALGVLGGPQAEARLEAMLADPWPEVRYNAATGLARQGSAKSTEVLLEMLDPGRLQSARAGVIINALRATSQLAAANPEADQHGLRQAVERLTHADVDAQIRVRAADVLQQLKTQK